MKYEELTHRIIGCAMRVHSTIGNGFQERIYQKCLEIEFQENDIGFAREYNMPIFYHGHQVGTRRVDFLVEGVISVEIKAVSQLTDVHLAQAINYLEAYNLETGLLLNFGGMKLVFKRVFNKKMNQDSQD